MPKVTIDGFDYNTEDLSDTGKQAGIPTIS